MLKKSLPTYQAKIINNKTALLKTKRIELKLHTLLCLVWCICMCVHAYPSDSFKGAAYVLGNRQLSIIILNFNKVLLKNVLLFVQTVKSVVLN